MIKKMQKTRNKLTKTIKIQKIDQRHPKIAQNWQKKKKNKSVEIFIF